MPPPPDDEGQLSALHGDDELVVHRIVRFPDSNAEEYADSFKSHAELGLPPTGIEQAHPLIYTGISAYRSQTAAKRTARAYPAIGQYVAKLRITAIDDVRFYRWGHATHLTLWGDPLKLASTTIDIVPIDEEDE